MLAAGICCHSVPRRGAGEQASAALTALSQFPLCATNSHGAVVAYRHAEINGRAGLEKRKFIVRLATWRWKEIKDREATLELPEIHWRRCSLRRRILISFGTNRTEKSRSRRASGGASKAASAPGSATRRRTTARSGTRTAISSSVLPTGPRRHRPLTSRTPRTTCLASSVSPSRHRSSAALRAPLVRLGAGKISTETRRSVCPRAGSWAVRWAARSSTRTGRG